MWWKKVLALKCLVKLRQVCTNIVHTWKQQYWPDAQPRSSPWRWQPTSTYHLYRELHSAGGSGAPGNSHVPGPTSLPILVALSAPSWPCNNAASCTLACVIINQDSWLGNQDCSIGNQDSSIENWPLSSPPQQPVAVRAPRAALPAAAPAPTRQDSRGCRGRWGPVRKRTALMSSLFYYKINIFQ